MIVDGQPAPTIEFKYTLTKNGGDRHTFWTYTGGGPAPYGKDGVVYETGNSSVWIFKEQARRVWEKLVSEGYTLA